MAIVVKTDLRNDFGQIRFQGHIRPTCLSIAASEVHQHAILCNSRLSIELSVEWLFYHACQKPGNFPNIGTTIPATQSVLKNPGQPLESFWPYSTKAPNIAKWRPPKNPRVLYSIQTNQINQDIFRTVWNKLNRNKPVVIIFRMSENFRTGPNSALKTEIPIMHSPNDIDEFGHAVTVVGCGYYKKKRVLLIRNSWGISWGYDGYAWLSEDYLKPRILGALAFL